MQQHTATLLLMIGLLVVWTEDVRAQADSTVAAQLVRITLKDGSEVVGTISREDSNIIAFRTLSHVSMTIPRDQVKGREIVRGELVRGEYWRTDPNSSRLLLAPTARSVPSGQGYVSAYEIFFPMVTVGAGDVLTLSGGMSLFPFAQSELFYVAPKIRPLHLNDFDVAGGVLYINSTSGSGDGVGILYGVGTYGPPRSALTFGLGWGFSGEDFADEPIVMIGGELQVAKSAKFISENWIPPHSDMQFYSFGIRFFGENLAADFALVHPGGARTSGFPFFPWIGFAYNFGTPK